MISKDLTVKDIQKHNSHRKASRNQKEHKQKTIDLQPKRKRKEKLSSGDLINLMGMNMQTCKH